MFKKIVLLLFISTVHLKTPCPKVLKKFLLNRYKHLFDHLIDKIQRKIRKIKRQRKAIEEKKNKLTVSEPKKEKIQKLPELHFPKIIPLGPFPIFSHGNNVHIQRINSPFNFFKSVSKKFTNNNGDVHGVVSETTEFPGKDGKIFVKHMEKKIEPKVESHFSHHPLIIGFGTINKIDESQPFNPLKAILGEDLFKKIKEKSEENKKEEIHDLVEKVIGSGYENDLLDFLRKESIKTKKEAQPELKNLHEPIRIKFRLKE